jgi:soluble lytic murein transglycosylase-like protein
VTRCKSWIAIVALLIAATALAAAVPPEADAAPSLRAKLRHAKRELRQATQRLSIARASLAVAMSALATPLPTSAPSETPTTPPAETLAPTPAPAPSETPAPTPIPTPTAGTAALAGAAAPAPALSVDELRAKIAQTRRAVRAWKLRVRRLARRYREQQLIAAWESRGQWRPIIALAAQKYHVSAAGIHAMMMRESGGRRFAGASSAFKGLFQYYPGTWRAGWNPWRGDSIYDGSSQIFATCYAVSRGYGRSMWPNTFLGGY